MGETPDQIRQDIEQTREHMGETIEAIGYRADVKTRMKDSISDKKDVVTSAVSGAKDKVVSAVAGSAETVGTAVTDVVPDRETLAASTKKGLGIAQENPIGLTIGGAALGFVAGLLIPSTRAEDERVGKLGDQVRESALEAGQEALEHGKNVAQDTLEAARDAAGEATREHGQEMAESLRESAQQIGSSEGDAGPTSG